MNVRIYNYPMSKKQSVFIVLLLLAGIFQLFAQSGSSALVPDELRPVDEMLVRGEFDAALSMLLDIYAQPAHVYPEYEITWRIAQAYLFRGDNAMFQGQDEQTYIDDYDQAEIWVNRTLELAPDKHFGYFWNAALIGQRGMMNGPLNSLVSSGEMLDMLNEAARLDPERGYVYYLASFLYQLLPRVISFGDRDAAVCMARAGIYYQDRMFENGIITHRYQDYYLQLARSLWDRNWSLAKRQREQEDKREDLARTQDPFERAKLFEAIVEIPAMSDREEARMILQQVRSRLDYENRIYADYRDWLKLDELEDSM